MEEENVSFPFIHAKIRRFNKIRMDYTDEFGGRQEGEKMEGFQAVLMQQGLDFLKGRHILDWRLHYGDIWIQKDIQVKLPKTTSVLEEYSRELKGLLSKYPALVQIPE